MSFTSDFLITSFVTAGMLDEETEKNVYIYEILESFKVDWTKIKGVWQQCMDTLLDVLVKMFCHADVKESCYKLKKTLDRDLDGKIWYIRSDTYHLTRSKVLYHPIVARK